MAALKLNYPSSKFDKAGSLKPEDFSAPEVYSILDHFKIDNTNNAKRAEINKRYNKILNGRNPFTRLYSAWNDKSRTYFWWDGQTKRFIKNFFETGYRENAVDELFNSTFDVGKLSSTQKSDILEKDYREANELDRTFHVPYNPGWSVFETKTPPLGRNVSWEAFVEYIAANQGDAAMERVLLKLREHYETLLITHSKIIIGKASINFVVFVTSITNT